MTKAFRFHGHGGPEVLRYEDVDLGEPGRGQVRIRNTAVAVNFRDVLMRRGTHAVRSFPSAIGLESAGVIDAVGPDVTGFSVGERVVYAGMPEGSYAQARIVPAERLIALPPEIDDLTAASMMIRGMTARCLLYEAYKVKPGDTVLIHAAAGGVGLIMCQWAKHLGATVVGTVGSDAKAAIARAHGCDYPIVYTREDFTQRVLDITGGEGVPVVYDSVGKATFEGSLRCVRRRGVMASFGEASGDPDPVPPRRLGAPWARSISPTPASRTTSLPEMSSLLPPMTFSIWSRAAGSRSGSARHTRCRRRHVPMPILNRARQRARS
jgi:NADPH2:quinone reductase